MRRDGERGADGRSAAWARLVASRVEPTIPWLVQVLHASGAPSIVLIGPAARPRLHDAEHDRPVADVELLVAPNRLRRAGMALRREGFVRVERGERCDTWLRRGLYVELHLALPHTSASPTRSYRLLRERAGRLTVGGVEVAVLDAVSHVVHLALRAAPHARHPGSPTLEAWRTARSSLTSAELIRAKEIADLLGAGGAWEQASAALVDGLRHDLGGGISAPAPAARSGAPARVRARAAWAAVARQVADGADRPGVVDPSSAR